MIRVLIGSLVGGIAMFLVGFIFWATPLNRVGISMLNDQQSANVQSALSANVPHTGFYVVPTPDTAGGTVLYGKGPVALLNYNSAGYSTADGKVMIGGFIQEVVVSLMIGFSLLAVAGRVTDFASRARLVVGFAATGTVLVSISDAIWMHGDWRYAIYAVVANSCMFIASGLVIARWFLPKGPTLH